MQLELGPILSAMLTSMLRTDFVCPACPDRCIKLTDSFPRDAFVSLPRHTIDSFINDLCEAVRFDAAPEPPPSPEGDAPAADDARVVDRLMRAVRFLHDVCTWRQTPSYIAVQAGCARDDLLRVVSACRVTSWVNNIARRPTTTVCSTAPAGNLLDLTDACDLACMRVPPALVAHSLYQTDRQDEAMYRYVVCRRAHLLAPPDFLLLGRLAADAGVAEHLSKAQMILSVQHGVFADREDETGLLGFFASTGVSSTVTAARSGASMAVCTEPHGPDGSRDGSDAGPRVDVTLPPPDEYSWAADRYDILIFSMTPFGLYRCWHYGYQPGRTVSECAAAGASHVYVLCVPYTYKKFDSV